jgi:hypothetical protein
MEPVPDPLLYRNSGGAGNQTRDFEECSQELCALDQRSGPFGLYPKRNMVQLLIMHLSLFSCYSLSVS